MGGGRVTSTEELTGREIERHTAQGDKPPQNVQFIVTRTGLEDLFRRAPAGKVGGEDLLTNEVFKLDPALMTKVCHPLLAKIGLKEQEPIVFKGGTQHELWKKKKDVTECGSSRGIMLENTLAVQLHRHHSQQLQPYLAAFVTETQAGSLPGRGTECAHILMQQHLLGAAPEKKAKAAIFIDVVSAFYSVMREVVMEIPSTSQEGLQKLCEKLKLPKSSCDALLARLVGESTFAAAEVPKDLERMVAESHVSTWFSTNGLRDLVAVDVGTRPGDPYGGIVFTFLAAEIWRAVRQEMEHENLVDLIPWSGQRSLLPGPVAENIMACDTSYLDVVWSCCRQDQWRSSRK